LPASHVSLLFFFSSSVAHLDLHSFPTRRSSDLLFHCLPVGSRGLWQSRRLHLSFSGHAGALPHGGSAGLSTPFAARSRPDNSARSEEHTSELQSRGHLVCRLLLEKKKKHNNKQ